MRSVSGSLIAAAVVALALVATFDAVRRGDGRRAPADTVAAAEDTKRGPPRLEGRGEIAGELRRARVSGVLFFIDDDCRYWGLELPELEWRWDDTEPSSVCSFSASLPISDPFYPGKLWEPEGRLVAHCRRNLVDVYAKKQNSYYRLRGCTPAWRPDGTVTYVGSDEVFELHRRCGPGLRPVEVGGGDHCGRLLLSRRDLEGAVHAGDRPFCPPPLARVCRDRSLRNLRVHDVAWLTASRIAAHVRFAWRGGGERDLLAVFDRRRLVSKPVVARRLDDLRLSPDRRYIVLRGGRRPSGLLFFDRDGRIVADDPLAGAHHVAWSPDERWTAVATGASTYVFPTSALRLFERGARRPPLIRLPLYAADLAWE